MRFVASLRGLGAAFAMASAAAGAAPAAEPLGLDAAIRRALEHNADLAAARLQGAVVEAEVETAGALPNPTVGVTVGRDDPEIAGELGMKLPLFGQRGAALASARAERPVTDAQVALETLALRAEVERAYWTLAAAQEQLGIANETARLADELARLIAAKVAAGAAPELDADQAKLEAAAAHQDALDRQSAVTEAQLALAALLGADGPLPQATDPLALPSAPPLDALLGKIGAHPEVARDEAQQAAAAARARQAAVELAPAPDVSLEVGRLATENTLGVRGTVGIEVPLLYRNGGALDQATAEGEVARAEAGAATSRRRTALREAYARLEAARRRSKFYAEEQGPAAEKVERLARLSYETGRATVVSVLAAGAARARAKSAAVDALAAANVALADVEEAAGVALGAAR